MSILIKNKEEFDSVVNKIMNNPNPKREDFLSGFSCLTDEGKKRVFRLVKEEIEKKE